MTPHASALQGPTARALAAVKRVHCAPPNYRPDAPVAAHMTCPRCLSRLNFTVTVDGKSNGRCTAAACINWASQ